MEEIKRLQAATAEAREMEVINQYSIKTKENEQKVAELTLYLTTMQESQLEDHKQRT